MPGRSSSSPGVRAAASFTRGERRVPLPRPSLRSVSRSREGAPRGPLGPTVVALRGIGGSLRAISVTSRSRSLNPGRVKTVRRPDPLARIVATGQLKRALLVMNARRRPSGDQAGRPTTSASGASGTDAPPSRGAKGVGRSRLYESSGGGLADDTWTLSALVHLDEWRGRRGERRVRRCPAGFAVRDVVCSRRAT